MSKKNKNVTDGWNEYEKLVMSKLDAHDKLFSDVLQQIRIQNEHHAELKLEILKTIEAHKSSCKIAEEFPRISRDIAGIKTSIENIRKTEKSIELNTKDIGILKTDVAQLQVKSGLWGALGGLVSLVFIIITVVVKNGYANFLTLISK